MTDCIQSLENSFVPSAPEAECWKWSGVCTQSILSDWIESIQTLPMQKKYSKRLYACMIELAQNAMRYGCKNAEKDASGAFFIHAVSDGWKLQFASFASLESAAYVKEQCDFLAGLDKVSLKELYLKRRRESHEKGTSLGAGLGLIDLARKSNLPLDCQRVICGFANTQILLFTVMISYDSE